MNSANFKPDGVISISNWGGIEIMLTKSTDGVYYRFNYGQDKWDDAEIYESEIQFDQEGEPYFMHGHTVHYLNEAMKIERKSNSDI